MAGVQLEFTGPGGERYATTSTATGSVCIDLPPGQYGVALNIAGYGAKRSQLTVPSAMPHHFRLLSDTLLGYVWPMYTTAGVGDGGGAGEFRCHSAEAFKLSLWRYGEHKAHERKIGWFDEHGPRATVQVTPDGDYTQTGAQWNKVGFPNPQHKQYIQAPESTGLYYFHAEAESGAFFSFRKSPCPTRPCAWHCADTSWLISPRTGFGTAWIVAPAPRAEGDPPRPPVALMMANMNW